MLPVHIDAYRSMQLGDDLGASRIERYLVALTKWDSGHYFFVGESVWHQWDAGDVVSWRAGEHHGSANCGRTDKVTMSVTGFAS